MNNLINKNFHGNDWGYFVDIEKYKPDLLHSSYLKCFKDIKIINLTRDFDSWLNSLCSQNFSQDKILRYLKFNISNYRFIPKVRNT